jgi:hypothetical protein
MARHWIIWTAARTGGTTLSSVLRNLSPDLPTVEDEPFQYSWSSVYEEWRRTGRAPDLPMLLQSGYCIKHVADGFAEEFNVLLARAARAADYRQIHLVRADEFARLVSRDVGRQLGAWQPRDSLAAIADVLAGRRHLGPLDVPELIDNARQVRRQWAVIRPQLGAVCEVAHEDLYGGDDLMRTAAVGRLIKELGLPGDGVTGICHALRNGGQDTSRVWHLVPNLDELRAALAKEEQSQ